MKQFNIYFYDTTSKVKKRRDENREKYQNHSKCKAHTLKKRLQQLKYRYSHTQSLLTITEPMQYLFVYDGYDRYGEKIWTAACDLGRVGADYMTI